MKQTPTLIYVGDACHAGSLRAATSACGWHVLHSDQMLEALAMYVFYYPDLFVLDDTPGSTLAADVYYHLLTVETPPVLILSDEPYKEAWRGISSSHVLVLPRDTAGADLLAAVRRLLLDDTTGEQSLKGGDSANISLHAG
jgi:DNA-binding response OmpR family regulator